MTTSDTMPTKKLKRLTARQQFLLAEAIKNEADRLRKERPTLAEAAAGFTQTLGFPVGTSSIQTAMVATGVTWDTSARSRRREPNWIDLDVRSPFPGEDGPARIVVEPSCRPGDGRLCGVTVPKDAPPAQSAAWLRRLADTLERHGTEIRAVKQYETDDPADAENDAKVQAGWDAILAADPI